MNVRHCRIVCVGILALGFVPRPARAIVTSGEAGSHVVTPGVAAYGMNLDGVAIVGSLHAFDEPISGCSGALISDRHLLCAAHCFDRNKDGRLESPMLGFTSDEIVFQLASGWVAIPYDFRLVQVPGNWPVEEADMAVVTLSHDAPAEVPRYPLHGGTSEVGQTAVVVGYGYTGHGSTGANDRFDPIPTKRAGLNRIDSIRDDFLGVEFLASDFDSGLAVNNALALLGFESDLGFGTDEVMSAMGDSGGPVFINGAIAGVTALIGRFPIADANARLDSSWGELSFDTRVSYFRSFIMAATGGAALFVPEPPSWVMLLLAVPVTAPRERRRVSV